MDFGSHVLGRLKIGSYVHIDFRIMLNLFCNLVKSGSVTRLGQYRVIKSVLETSN